MNGTKNLLIGLVTVVAMPVFAETKTTSISSGEDRAFTRLNSDFLKQTPTASGVNLSGVPIAASIRAVGPKNPLRRHPLAGQSNHVTKPPPLRALAF